MWPAWWPVMTKRETELMKGQLDHDGTAGCLVLVAVVIGLVLLTELVANLSGGPPLP